MSKTRLNLRQLNAIGNNNIATDDEVSEAINLHNLADNPHPQYATLSDIQNNSTVTTENINAININKIAVANGIASLDSNANIPLNQIPNYCGEFLEYANFTSLPITGDTSKFYITLDNNNHYSWINGVYVEEEFGWQDLIGDIKPRINGVFAPTLKELTPNNTEFSYGVGDKCECKFHIPHDYVPKTDMFVHIHWTHTGTNITGSLIVNIYSIYAKGHQQASFTNNASTVINVTGLNITNTPNLMHRVDEVLFSTRNGSPSLLNSNIIEADGFILLTFETNTVPSISGSPYTNDVYIISLDIHYQSTKLPTKNKSPNFYL